MVRRTCATKNHAKIVIFQSTPLWKGAPTQRATLEKFDFNGSTEDAEDHGRPLIEMVLQITDGPIDTFFLKYNTKYQPEKKANKCEMSRRSAAADRVRPTLPFSRTGRHEQSPPTTIATICCWTDHWSMQPE